MISDILFDMIDELNQTKNPILEILTSASDEIDLYKSSYSDYDKVKIEYAHSLIKEEIETEGANLNYLIETSEELAKYLSSLP